MCVVGFPSQPSAKSGPRPFLAPRFSHVPSTPASYRHVERVLVKDLCHNQRRLQGHQSMPILRVLPGKFGDGEAAFDLIHTRGQDVEGGRETGSM